MFICLDELSPILGAEIKVSWIYNLDKEALIPFCKENFESGRTVEELRKRLVKFYRTRGYQST